MSSAKAEALPVTLTNLRSPKTLLLRFVAKRTARSSLLWGVIFASYIISKAATFIQTYSTAASREKLAASLGSNVGVEALLGVAHHIETVAGYEVWNFLCFITAVGAIWAILLTTKTFRGEEDSGRWELFLAGQTTARQAARNALVGLLSGLIILYAFFALTILSFAHWHGTNYSTSAALFFALSLTLGAAEFMAVGALASQLMPVRSRASSFSLAVFGVFYFIRLIADTTSAHWLLNVSPLGWIERLQPLYATDIVWLVPIVAFIAVVSYLAVVLAGRRDLNAATFADKDEAEPHTRMLKTPLRAAIRLNRTVTLSWLVSIGLVGFVYALLTKAATQAFSQSAKIEKIFNKLSQSNAALSTEFMGIIFFMIMLITMFYAATAVARVREDEAQGYLDNFLVRPVSRLRCLSGRLGIIVSTVVVAGLLSGVMSWAGEASQHSGLPFHTLLLAGINAMAPVLLVVGIGMFVFGSLPRLTNFLTYGAIAWSFLLVMLSSGVNLNHWLLDTSILHHVTFAPAASANWHTDGILVLIGAALTLIGMWRFNTRDIQGE